MFKKGMVLVPVCVLCWGLAVQAEPFSLPVVDDGHVCNDSQYGPTAAYNTSAIHVRNTADPRRRVGYLKFDISSIRGPGRLVSDVSISLYGYSAGNVDVYGVVETQDHTVADFQALTWNTAPGVQNNPTPALSSPVQLDMADLAGPFLSFRTPAQGVRESSPVSEGLAAFINQDTDGTIVLLLSAPEGQSAMIRELDYSSGIGAALLEGQVGGVPTSASGPSPVDGAAEVLSDTALTWTPGTYAATHDVYLGTAFADVNAADRANPKGVLVSQGQTGTTYDPVGPLAFGQTYYWRVDEVNAPPTSTIYRGMIWSFATEPYAYLVRPTKATASSYNDATMLPDKTIDGSGLNATDGHSTDTDDMWLSSGTDLGPVWIQYEFADVVKLYQMWVWNSNQGIELVLGFGAKDVAIEVSQDGQTWTALAGVPTFAQAPGAAGYTPNTTVDFGGVLARYVRLTIQSNWSAMGLAQRGLSEVRFFHIPLVAREQQPANAATGVPLDATLTWRPGREAVRHEVYFGTDPNAVALAQTLTGRELALSTLDPGYGQTYFWKVAEVNDAAAIRSWMSEVWSFSTLGYGVVEDFESYDDGCKRVYYAWKGGAGNSANPDCGVADYSGNGTGSIVGNDAAPYAERTIFRSGSQSMPFWYDNTLPPFYSEASREWDTAQSWTLGRADSLAVYYRYEGLTRDFAEVSPGVIVMNGMGTDIYGTADEGRFVYKQLSGDGAIVARVENLANTNAWAKAAVMIRETLDAGSPFIIGVYGGANGVRMQMRLAAGGEATSDSGTATAGQLAARAPVWVKVERTGNEFRAYYSADGQAWTPMSGNPQTIPMGTSVYIGLAVTSHVTGVVCGARFSGVSTTGAVTGSWQSADLGVAQTAGGDSLDPVYLVVEDSRGKVKVLPGPDPKAAITGAWEQWNAPLSQLTAAGVDLGNVKKITIGVGYRVSPKAGVSGNLYLADLRLIRAGGN